MKRKQIYLPEQMIERVTAEGKKRGICFSEMLRRIVDEWREGE